MKKYLQENELIFQKAHKVFMQIKMLPLGNSVQKSEGAGVEIQLCLSLAGASCRAISPARLAFCNAVDTIEGSSLSC